MKIKTSELIGDALDRMVLLCEEGRPSCGFYSTDWADGGPIIEREGISIESQTMRGADGKFAWCAALTYEDKEFEGVTRAEEYGPTPLIAAMRCYVASKLGDEVDVPDDQVKKLDQNA